MIHRPAPRRLLSVLTCAALLAGGALHAVTWAAEDTPHALPAEVCRNLFLIPLALDGREERTLWMVLDTGASETSVDPDAIQRVSGKRVKAGKRVTLRDATAGPLEIHRLPAKVHSMDHLSRALGREIDGILGFPTFRKFLLTLDYPNGEVRIGPGTLPPPDGIEVFTMSGKWRPYLSVEIGDETFTLLLDSGSTGSLRLRPEDDLSWQTPPRPVSAMVRYASVEVRSAGRLDHAVRVASVTVDRPIVELSEGTRLIGTRIMRPLVWTFDQRNKRVRARGAPDDPLLDEPLRGMGTAMNPRAEGYEVFVVHPGTPAERAGLRAGDLVTAVDGTPVYERGCEPIDTGDVDRRVLTIHRGAEVLDIEVAYEVLVP